MKLRKVDEIENVELFGHEKSGSVRDLLSCGCCITRIFTRVDPGSSRLANKTFVYTIRFVEHSGLQNLTSSHIL